MPDIDKNEGRIRENFPEIESELFWELYAVAKRYSLLNVTGFYNLWQSAHYIARSRIAGEIVECGCFLGGATIFLSLTLQHLGTWRPITLFDTFEGPPLNMVDTVFGVEHRGHKLPDFEESVRMNIQEAGADLGQFRLVRGKAEDTTPRFNFVGICMLRLDTDFYDSTKVEWEALYPKLVRGGVIIVDDYGLFQGSRRATDEYLAGLQSPPLLNRIDQGIWAGIKP